MTAEFGAFLAALALVASLAQGGLGLFGARSLPRAAAAAACAQIAVVCVGGAFALLVSAFLASDFSVALVANHSHTLKPLIYKIAGTWGNHEGSMLLWCLISTGFGAAIASLPGRLPQGLWARTVGVQGLVTAAALAYTLVLSSPFARLDPAPLEGGDLNPLLQDPALALHPPFLYLGYVGLSVPFSFAIAALLEGKADQAWASAVRPWALAAWTCLTIGIGLGSYWAYYELGWGGWWFWDPVENASFVPWLGGAALLHSAIVTERRGNLASWTILLAILGFGMALLGTFLVRSGVLTSVHAFAVDPQRGVAVLAIMLVALGAGFGLFAWRGAALARPAPFDPVSRESLLLINNLGLAVGAGVVLLGTLYPLIIDALTGELISVGPPFFNIAFGPLMAALFLALPFGPLLAWRKGALAPAFRKLWLAALASALAGVGLLIAAPQAAWTALGVMVGAWLILGTLAYLWKRMEARPARAFALPLAVWGMALAHAGLGVLTIGAVVETGFRQERSVLLAPGEATAFAERQVRLLEVTQVAGPNFVADVARLEVTEGGRTRTLTAERRFYPAADSATTEVGILPSPMGDLYVALGEPSRTEPGWTVRMYKKPLVQLIFFGASMLAAGGALSLVGLMRRRVAARAPAAAPARDPVATPAE